jgi:hypothetical protein
MGKPHRLGKKNFDEVSGRRPFSWPSALRNALGEGLTSLDICLVFLIGKVEIPVSTVGQMFGNSEKSHKVIFERGS